MNQIWFLKILSWGQSITLETHGRHRDPWHCLWALGGHLPMRTLAHSHHFSQEGAVLIPTYTYHCTDALIEKHEHQSLGFVFVFSGSVTWPALTFFVVYMCNSVRVNGRKRVLEIEINGKESFQITKIGIKRQWI